MATYSAAESLTKQALVSMSRPCTGDNSPLCLISNGYIAV